MQSGRVAPVDNSREKGRKRGKEKGEKEGKKEKEREEEERKREEKSLDHGVKGLRVAYFMRLRRTY
ncbi:MAG: hypothetical protein EGP85_13830 [Bifidobacterium bifidum]|nr:hypothetical protein [Bifidobacterium bifidum]